MTVTHERVHRKFYAIFDDLPQSYWLNAGKFDVMRYCAFGYIVNYENLSQTSMTMGPLSHKLQYEV